MELVTPGIGLLFWMLLAFTIVMVILKKFAWKPILAMLKDREESIDNALKAADNARDEMSKLQSDNEKILAEARADRDVMLKEGKEMKDQIISDAKSGAVTEANKIIEAAKATIESEKKAAVSDMKKQIAEFSIQISEKILREELSNSDKQEKLVENLLKDVKFN